MKRIIEFYKLISRRADYLLHHVAAEDIYLLILAITIHFLPWYWAMATADAAAVLALVLKEVYDYFHPDTQSVELMDIQSGLVALVYVNIITVGIFAFR